MLTIGVLLGRGPGVCLALRAQTEQEAVKLQPARPANTNPGCSAALSHFSSFILIFSRLLHCHIHTQVMPKPPAGHPRPPPRVAWLEDVPANPAIPTWTARRKPQRAGRAAGQFLHPFENRQKLRNCSGCFLLGLTLANDREDTQHLAGRTPAPCNEGRSQHPLSPTSGGCTGEEFWVLGGWLQRAGLTRGLGSLVLADGHRLGQHLLGQTLEEPGTGALPHLGGAGSEVAPMSQGDTGCGPGSLQPPASPGSCLQQATPRTCTPVPCSDPASPPAN